MKIVDINAYPLRCRLDRPFSYSQKWFTHRTALLVKITTDEGIVGWGDVFCHDAGAALAVLIKRTLAPLMVDRNPLDIAVLWDMLYNWTKDYGQKGLTTAAISGIDIALWDIFGKATGLPVSQLLGGAFRDRVRGYATGLYRVESDDIISHLVEEANGYVQQGFSAIKMKVGFGLEEDIRSVRAVRRAIGSGVDLMVDANHAYDVPTAIRLGRVLEEEGVAWFEEPVSPEDIEGYCAVRAALDVPIAGGEAEFTRYGFRRFVCAGAVDIVQPDICIAGGISEGLKIADLARTWHVRCLPHVWGTAVGLAASLHYIAALPDTPPSLNPQPMVLELDQTEHPLRHITVEPIRFEDGYVYVPNGPGLGVEVDENRLEPYLIH